MTSLTANLLRLLLANKWETHSSSDRVSLNKLNKGHTIPESKEIESTEEVLRPPRKNRINKYQELHKMHCSCRVRASNKFFRMESRGHTAIRSVLLWLPKLNIVAAACLLIEAMAWNNLAGVRCARVAGKLEHLKHWNAKLGRKFKREVTKQVHYFWERWLFSGGILINLFSQIRCLLLANPPRHAILHEISKQLWTRTLFFYFRPDNPSLPSQSSLAESLWQRQPPYSPDTARIRSQWQRQSRPWCETRSQSAKNDDGETWAF